MSKNDYLIIKHPKVINFYKMNNNIDIDNINLLLVNMLEEYNKSLCDTLSTSLSKEILERLKDQNIILDNLSKTLLIKLSDMKNDNIKEIRQHIDNNSNISIIKIIDKLELENSKLLNEIMPKRTNEIENIINNFYNKIRNTDDIKDLEKRYIENIQTLECNILKNINTSENKIVSQLYEIKDENKTLTKIENELLNFLDKYKNSSLKGQISENYIEQTLNELFKSSEIERTTGENKSGDFIIHRENNNPILIEIKNYTRNVPTEEVRKFRRDVSENKMSGIMISMNSGICKKNNFQIDITEDNNICVYIHNLNFDNDKIKIAVELIDNLHYKLSQNINNGININISQLQEITKEYNNFLLKRNNIIISIKENNKKIIQSLENMELMNLNIFLSSKYNLSNNNLKCIYCNKFIGTNSKSLSTHSRKCKIKFIQNNNNNNNNNNDDDDNDDDDDDNQIEI